MSEMSEFVNYSGLSVGRELFRIVDRVLKCEPFFWPEQIPSELEVVKYFFLLIFDLIN